MKCLLLSVLILCQSITCVGAEELLSDKNLSADEEVHMLLEEYQNLCSQLKYLQRYGSEEENIEEHNKGEKALITQIESKRNELISHGVVFNENIPGEAKELILGNCYTLSPMGGVWDNIPSFDAFLELCDVNLYRTNVIYNGKKYYVCEVNINNKEIRGLSRVYTDVVTLKGKVSNNELEKFLASTFLWTATNTATSLLPVAPAWALSAITSLIPDFKGESVIHGSSVVTADRFMVDEYAQYIYIIDPNDSNANWELCVASNRTYIQWHVNFFTKNREIVQ